MNKVLEKICFRFLDKMKAEEGIMGAWNFGSATHGLSDEYSDVDLIFLVEGNKFHEMNEKLTSYLAAVCDEVVMCWPETFNSEAITNYGYLLRCEGELLQFDVFLINSEKTDDFMCRLHYTDLKMDNILFDKDGNIRKLAENAPSGEVWSADVEKLRNTYWFHINMTIKYLKREDFFKLNNVMRILMDTHVSLLLCGYDKISWGGPANKLHFIPKEKQAHVKGYGCVDDFDINIKKLFRNMEMFLEDYADVCAIKGLPVQKETAQIIMNNWGKNFEQNGEN
ncbi:MAG: aminoglycoside 6-adenylyltransferase [Butyrivibrio sp.]